MRQPLRIASVPSTATGTTGAPVSSASRPTPRLGWPSEPGRVRVPSGKISTMSPRARIALAVSMKSAVAGAAVDRERTEGAQHPPQQAVVEEDLLLGHVVHRAPGHAGDDERIEEAAVVGGDDHRAARGDVLAPDPLEAEVDEKERLERHADESVEEQVGSFLPRSPVITVVLHRTMRYPAGLRPLQLGRDEPGPAIPPGRCVAPSVERSPRRSGRSSSRWTRWRSPAATTTSSCWARP